MSEQDRKKMQELDAAAEKAGGFVDFVFDKNTHYDYRKIIEYCKEKGIEPQDMTIRELGQFVIHA